MKTDKLMFLFFIIMVISFVGCLKSYQIKNDFTFCFFIGLLASSSFFGGITFQENKNQ